MKLASYRAKGTNRFGVVTGDEIVDLQAFDPALGPSLRTFLAAAPAGLEVAQAAVARGRIRHAMAQIMLRPSIPDPPKVLGIGMNFKFFVEGLRQRGMLPPVLPRTWFSRPSRCVVGHGDAVMLPAGSAALDFEGELAVVIGRQCHGVTAKQAPGVIAGYTVGNDITIRDWAAVSPLLGKSFDTHVPLGPVLVTADEIGDPHDLRITVAVNGERRQTGSTAEMITNCYELIAELSAVMTLEPGDVIFTGTPEGCAIFDQPPRFLKPGDRVRIEIEGIGVLENHIVADLRAPLPATTTGLQNVA